MPVVYFSFNSIVPPLPKRQSYESSGSLKSQNVMICIDFLEGKCDKVGCRHIHERNGRNYVWQYKELSGRNVWIFFSKRCSEDLEIGYSNDHVEHLNVFIKPFEG